MTKPTTKLDPHTRITDRILAELEQGTRPWFKPWSGGDMATSGATRPLRATGQPYRGINVLLLWIPATVNHGGDRAYYIPSADRIQLPPFAAFHDAHGYYTTRGHETVHWTNHKSRLDRSFGREKWGDEGYAREELVAELGAAFLAADLGLSIEPRPDHASYLASWIKVLQNDTRAIVQAAAHAERAVAYLHQLANPDDVREAA